MKLKGIKPRQMFSATRKFVHNNKALIGLIAAGVGFTGAIVWTGKATVQAVRRTDYETQKKDAPLTLQELVEINWKYYIPPALLWAGSIASLALAAHGYKGSTKLLAAMYAASEAEREKLEEAAMEYLGPKKFEEFQYKAADKVLQETPLDNNTVYETGHGSHLCYDTYSGRFFRCCMDHIKRAVNEFNNDIYTHQTGKSYNDLFYEISPVFEDIEFGKDVGWNYMKGGADLRYSSHLKNGEPCLIISYKVRPYLNFDYDY